MQETVIEIPLTAPDQQGVPTTVVPGELVRCDNAYITKFNNNGTIRVEKREGYVEQTLDIRSPVTGERVVNTGFQGGPTLFSSVGEQVVVAAADHPHVLAENGNSWSKYDYVYSPTVMKQSVLYGGNVQTANPDCAEINGVRMYTWTESGLGLPTPTADRLMGMVKDADGTVLRQPFIVASNPAPQTIRGKVCTDGVRFWVVFSVDTTVVCRVYDTDGIEVASQSIDTLINAASTWDLAYQGGAVLFARCKTDTVYMTRLSISGTTITATQTDMSFVALGDAGVAFAENETNDGYAYLMTAHHDADGGFVERAFRIANTTTTPTVSAYFSIPQTSGSGIVYTEDGAGGFTGITCQLTGVYRTDGLHMQIGVLDRPDSLGDRRLDRTVFLLCVVGFTATVQRVVRGARPASRTFNLPGTNRQCLLLYYPSALTQVMTAGPGIPDPVAVAGQPTYFMFDVETQQVMGRFLDGVAGNEWTRVNYPASGIAWTTGPYCFCLPRTFLDSDGKLHLPVGYNAESINNTSEGVYLGRHGRAAFDPYPYVKTTVVNAVNIMELVFGGAGQAVEYNSELLMPGALTTSFTGLDFAEQGVSMAPEQPTATASTGTATLTVGGQYTYVLVFEYTDVNGRRIRSAPSIPLQKTLTGTQNHISLSVLTNQMTNRSNLTIAIYRNAIVAGAPTSTHYKISNDLNPLINSFDSATPFVTFDDTVTDTQALSGEELYTDLGFSPRDPAPACSSFCVFENRVFGIGPDNSVWFTGEANDTDPLWFNADTHRFFMPTTDELVRIEGMDGRLFLFCRNSIWFVPGGRWPTANGANSGMEAPTKYGFSNGCTGWTKPIKDGIAYASSAGGVWMITRGGENVQLGSNVTDDFAGQTVSGIAVDSAQRVAFALAGTSRVQMVYDQVSKVWSKWTAKTDVLLNHTVRGRFAYVDNTSLRIQTANIWYDDDYAGVPEWYTLTASAPFSLMNFKGAKRVWEFMLSGERKADHTLTVSATYLAEDIDVSESWTFVPALGERFENDFQPMVEEMERIDLELSDAPGAGGEGSDQNGNSFAWDLTSFTVGSEGGLIRTPPTTRRRTST